MTKETATEVLRRDGVALHIRVGLNSGDVIVGEIGSGPGRYTAVGHPSVWRNGWRQPPLPDGVLCSLSTARLVETPPGSGPSKTLPSRALTPVPARLLSRWSPTGRCWAATRARCWAAKRELNWLRNVLDTVASIVGIVGAPGLGKSRLTIEFTAIAASRGADVVLIRCEAHTTTIAFNATSRLLRAMFRVDGLDAAAREQTTAVRRAPPPDSADARILFEAMGIDDSNADPLRNQRRWPPPQRRGDGAGCPGALNRTVFVLEDADSNQHAKRRRPR